MWSKTLLLAAAMLAAASALPMAAPAQAQVIQPGWIVPAQGRQRDQQAQERITARDAVDAARRRYGGEPLGSPQRQQIGNRVFFVINWRFPNELVREVRVDAVTGQVS